MSINAPRSLACDPSPIQHLRLDDLLESAVDGRANVGNVLPEVDGGQRALGNTLRGELELLLSQQVSTIRNNFRDR